MTTINQKWTRKKGEEEVKKKLIGRWVQQFGNRFITAAAAAAAAVAASPELIQRRLCVRTSA